MTIGQLLGAATGKPSRHPYPAHMLDARRIAADGIVLLKNERDVLPLKEKTIALFGTGASDTVFCGTGSGFVFAPYTVSIEQGLQNAGLKISSKSWLKRFKKESRQANKKDKTLNLLDRMWSGLRILIDDLPITKEELQEAKQADTAIYVLRRNAGEGGDRKNEKGDYLLTDQERENLTLLGKHFRHTVVVLNTCVVDASFMNEIPGLDALVLTGLPGCEGGNALADVLTGKVCPGGRLTDTWAVRYEDNPAAATFAANDGDSMQEDYTEDIFVGYRYFDSFGVKPLFPFGFGMSYTSFRMEAVEAHADWKELWVKLRITNTGSVPGRETAQLYVTAPEGRLTKPYQELKAYQKTRLLQPGESEVLTLGLPTESLASFDEEKAAFVMEPGDYLIRTGCHSRDTSISAVLHLDDEAVIRQLRNELQPDHPLKTLKAPARNNIVAANADWMSLDSADAIMLPLRSCDCETVDGACKTKESDNITFKRMEGVLPAMDASFLDVKAGKVSLEEFVASLEDEVLLRLVTGAANETPYQPKPRISKKLKAPKAPSSSGSTTGLFLNSLGIPKWLLTDGPAGIHLPGCGATCYPVGTVIAQTWDDDLAALMGRGVGKELAAYHYHVILGPGMNIHRDPLCGRNFEYYAEDPLLSGKMAAATTRGVQATPGTAVSLKHFACNNQETNRLSQNSTVSERALREIYLKGFEICVRESAPRTVMTSYNKLNGVHTSERYDLLTNILRGEWGFAGLVMTDWGTESTKAYDYHAGNDLVMGGYDTDILMAALKGTAPEFGDDGYVRTVEKKVFGGFIKQKIEFWNCFLPDADGTDTVSVSVAAEKPLNDRVAELAAKGVADIMENKDGTRTITYHGTNRGQYLKRSDLQICACRVLKQLADIE